MDKGSLIISGVCIGAVLSWAYSFVGYCIEYVKGREDRKVTRDLIKQAEAYHSKTDRLHRNNTHRHF